MNLKPSGPVGGVPPPRDDAMTVEGTRPTDRSDEATGLPGIRQWRTVYWIVAGIFVLWVGLLTVLTKLYP
jgi:hypothetical protein